jgi:hypothetical protein
MDVVIAEKGAYCLTTSMSAAEARGRAAAFKPSAFGAMMRLLQRPKDTDIEIEENGLRYEPMWHATSRLRFVYDRRETYNVPVKALFVKTVTVGGTEHTVTPGQQPQIAVPVVEHYIREETKDLWLDGVSGKPIDAKPYAAAPNSVIPDGTFAPENAQVITPTVRASTVIRTLLGDDVKPPEADEVTEETVTVDRIDLYFRPLYAFTFSWPTKNKTAHFSLDAITGEMRADTDKSAPSLGAIFQPETLFDLGAETINLVVPGGAIALKVVKALADRSKER